LLQDVTEVYATKGKKVIHLRLTDGDRATTAAEAAALVIGPSGNLRAPALRRGPTLVVGFDPTMFASAFA
jgi:hypothetical protein